MTVTYANVDNSSARVLVAASHLGNDVQTLRWALRSAVLITAVIAVASFVLSFSALWDLATLAGMPRRLSWLWPVIVDGTILQATISVIAVTSAPAARRTRSFFWTVLAVAAAVSVASNALHAFITGNGTLDPALASAIATVAPVSLLAATHCLALLARAKTGTSVARTGQELIHPARHEAPSSTPGAPGGAGEWPDWRTLAGAMHANGLATRQPAELAEILKLRFEDDLSHRQIARRLELHHSTVGRVVDAARPLIADPASTQASNIPATATNPVVRVTA